MFNFLRNCQIIFQSSCSILHPHQQCLRASVPPWSWQYLVWLVFLILAILRGIWYSNRFCSYLLNDNEGFLGDSVCKESAYKARNAGDTGSIPGLGRSPGRGHGNLLRYSFLENPMDRGDWRAIQSMGLQKSWTQLKRWSTSTMTMMLSIFVICSFAIHVSSLVKCKFKSFIHF